MSHVVVRSESTVEETGFILYRTNRIISEALARYDSQYWEMWHFTLNTSTKYLNKLQPGPTRHRICFVFLYLTFYELIVVQLFSSDSNYFKYRRMYSIHYTVNSREEEKIYHKQGFRARLLKKASVDLKPLFCKSEQTKEPEKIDAVCHVKFAKGFMCHSFKNIFCVL